MASTQCYENVAFSAPGNISNAESDSNQSNIHKDEPNTYESLQKFNPEPLKKEKIATYRAACNRQYLCLGILMGVLCSIALVAIGFAAAAWKNSIDGQGAAVESLLRELEERLERLSSNNDDLTTRLINMEKKYNTSGIVVDSETSIAERIFQTEVRLRYIENVTETRIDTIESDNSELGNKINAVESQMDTIASDNSELGSKINTVESQIDTIESDNSELGSKINAVESTLETIENEADAIGSRMTVIETSSQSAAESAFMAVMTVGYFRPTQFQVIPFNTAPVNPGSHYNTSSYVYTCPHHGLYMFSFSLYSDTIGGTFDERSVSGALMLDGLRVAEVFSQNNDHVYWQAHQVATTAVVDCPAGSTVWVQSRYGVNKILGSVIYPRTIFTGYAIVLY